MKIYTYKHIPNSPMSNEEKEILSNSGLKAIILSSKLNHLQEEIQKSGVTFRAVAVEVPAIVCSIEIEGASPELEKKIKAALGV